MNSAENPDPNFRTNGGKILTKEQIKAASKNIQKKSSYTKEDLGVIKN